jgi:hypothetical protein
MSKTTTGATEVFVIKRQKFQHFWTNLGYRLSNAIYLLCHSESDTLYVTGNSSLFVQTLKVTHDVGKYWDFVYEISIANKTLLVTPEQAHCFFGNSTEAPTDNSKKSTPIPCENFFFKSQKKRVVGV